MKDYPDKIKNEAELEELLSRPSAETVELFKRLEGDILFLGIAGKIGPSLAHMTKRACLEAGIKKRIIGVSRFSNPAEKDLIESWGIETIQGDLLDRKYLESLPKVKNVFFLAGMKFGSEENLSLTWAMNSFLPALVAEYFKDSRIVAYSTGCVYPMVSVDSGGSKETNKPEPVGEYAQSCLGRERMFEYGSRKYKTPIALIRLNYAVEPRYGVLVDIATKVKNNQPVDLTMGYFNAIWQGDANNMVLRSMEHTASPAWIVNIAGPETLRVRDVALEFGKLFNKEVQFTGSEAETALLSNAEQAFRFFGKPNVPVQKVMEWTARWMEEDKKLLGKPTYFEVRDGKY
ncbi:NAD-dependent epimerase/dehydratase family protein [Mariniphaga sp.]|uniref:NAD-dependent epimerase/dehydratase family protein n=1 Tax=Mariniphaga sp. TaxID=1954475 RepID=UPI0035698357